MSITAAVLDGLLSIDHRVYVLLLVVSVVAGVSAYDRRAAS